VDKKRRTRKIIKNKRKLITTTLTKPQQRISIKTYFRNIFLSQGVRQRYLTIAGSSVDGGIKNAPFETKLIIKNGR
jgi:hypothetical protein